MILEKEASSYVPSRFCPRSNRALHLVIQAAMQLLKVVENNLSPGSQATHHHLCSTSKVDFTYVLRSSALPCTVLAWTSQPNWNAESPEEPHSLINPSQLPSASRKPKQNKRAPPIFFYLPSSYLRLPNKIHLDNHEKHKVPNQKTKNKKKTPKKFNKRRARAAIRTRGLSQIKSSEF